MDYISNQNRYIMVFLPITKDNPNDNTKKYLALFPYNDHKTGISQVKLNKFISKANGLIHFKVFQVFPIIFNIKDVA